MAHFVAADVAVAVLSRGTVGKKRRSYGTITLTTTAATYDNPGGIYLPSYKSFGFWKQIDQMFLTLSPSTAGTAASDGLVYKYDKALHTIRLFRTAGGTPAGTVSAPTFTGVAATGTGTVSAPTFTGVAATPTGTVSAPTFTADSHAHTSIADPIVITGTVSAPTFTGVAATPTGTVSAPTFTGVAATPTGTVSAPVFTGTAVAAAGLAEFPDVTVITAAASLVLYFDAIGV